MITIKIDKEKQIFKGVQVLGHAMYDEYGKDIVCSAVSSIVITTINATLSFDQKSISYLSSSKGLAIKVLKQDKITQTLIRNMVRMLKELEIKYRDYIVIK